MVNDVKINLSVEEMAKAGVNFGHTVSRLHPKIKEYVKTTAESCNMPFVVERWLGGTLTNFETISKRVKYFRDFEIKKATGDLDKYTKKERLLFDKELVILKNKFEGIKN